MRPRSIIKVSLHWLCVLLLTPILLFDWLERSIFHRSLFFGVFTQLLAVVPGMPGVYLRAAYYRFALTSCSWEVHVGFGSIFSHRDAILGGRVSMGNYCIIGHARIGSGARIGSRVSIPSGKRQHFDDQGRLASIDRFEQVRIGENVWIGEGAIVMADVGNECVISAGAVVVQPITDNHLAGGNPARILKPVESETV